MAQIEEFYLNDASYEPSCSSMATNNNNSGSSSSSSDIISISSSSNASSSLNDDSFIEEDMVEADKEDVTISFLFKYVILFRCRHNVVPE